MELKYVYCCTYSLLHAQKDALTHNKDIMVNLVEPTFQCEISRAYKMDRNDESKYTSHCRVTIFRSPVRTVTSLQFIHALSTADIFPHFEWCYCK
jgi:hypothetical protein